MNIGKTGTGGERAAEDYLKRRGYRVLARNYYTRYGELDLVVCREGYIVFVEVKTRAAGSLVPLEQTVTRAKLTRLYRSACLYLEAAPSELQPRFDFIGVTCCDGRYTVEQHLENILS